MKREILLSDISAENLLSSNDMAKLDARGCAGCSYCCREMTDTIILDPWDVYSLAKGLGAGDKNNISLSYLLSEGKAELAVYEGLTLPHLAAADSGKGMSCVFLDSNDRCSIHPFRPGLCRLFPLGRLYENDTFYYFLQSGECKKSERTEVEISKWLGIKNLKAYEDYILSWHEIQENIKAYLKNCDEENAKKINMTMLSLFYLLPYEPGRDFYEQFEERKKRIS